MSKAQEERGERETEEGITKVEEKKKKKIRKWVNELK